MSMLLDRDTMLQPFYKIEFNGVELSESLKKFITLVEFEESDEEANLVRITVSDPDFYFLNSTNLTKKMKVKVWLGFVKKYRQVLEGEVTHIEADLGDDGIPNVVIGCTDTSNAMTYTKKTRKWTKQTANAIVSSIAREYGYTAVTPSSTTAIDEVSQEDETDAQIIKRLADDEGFQFYINSQNKTIYFGIRFNDTAIVDNLYYNSKDCTIRNFRPTFVEKNKPNNVKSTESGVSDKDGSTVTSSSSASSSSSGSSSSRGSSGSSGSSTGGEYGIDPVTGAVVKR